MQNDFPRAINWIMVTFAGNYFLTGANTNFVITINDDDTVTIGNHYFSTHVMFENEPIITGDTCACPIDSLFAFLQISYIQMDQLFISMNKFL